MLRIAQISLLLLSLLLSPWALAANEIERANELIGEGKYIEAFELLEPLEFDYSGDETFDLLFGFAALEAGHVSLATLALERVLAVNPDNNTARFHLARAYFVLSDYDGARREFEMLLSMNPTAGVRETVGQYLDAIAAREPQASTVTTGFISLGIGNDSNVTGGINESPLLTPVGLLPLDESGLEDEDDYTSVNAGIDLIHRFSDVNSVYIGGDVNDRAHDDRDDLDYTLFGVRSGYQRFVGNQVYRGGIVLGYLDVDGDDYQDSEGLELEWRNTLEQRTQIGVVLSLTEYRHEEEFALDADESDYDDTRLNLSYLRVLGEQGDKIFSAALDLGQEEEVNRRNGGDKDYIELSLTGQIQFSDRFSGFLLVTYAEEDYDELDVFFAEKRSDSQTTLIGGLVFEFGNDFSIRATAVLSETDSNLALYETDREDISISLRKDFF